MDKEEYNSYKNIVLKNKYFEESQTIDLVNQLYDNKTLTKALKTKQRQTGIGYALLLLGAIQFRKLKITHFTFVHKELELQRIDFNC